MVIVIVDPKIKDVQAKVGKIRWDWYVIGGRWDGIMCGLPKIDDKQGGFNFGDQFHTLERNTCKVSKIKSKPFAILTPDGVCHERGEMRWFGYGDKEEQPNEWNKEAKKIFAKYPNHTAVSLDVHI
jgi:hypothetical protein